MPSGKNVTQIAAGPVQWKDASGAWRPFDFTLQANRHGWSGSVGAMKIRFPSRLGATSSDPVRIVGTQGDVLTMQPLSGTEATGTSSDGVLTYTSIQPGIDVQLRLTPRGVKEDVVLLHRDAPRSLAYRVNLDARDGTAVPDGRGGIRIARGDRTVFRIPPPVMFDANGVPFVGDSFAVRKVGVGSWHVMLNPNSEWLDATDRKWPVTIDPAIEEDPFTSPVSEYCRVYDYGSNLGYSHGAFCGPSYFMYTGHEYLSREDGFFWESLNASVLRFNTLSLVPTDRVQRATLRMYRLSGSRGYNSSPVRIYGIKEPWSAASFADWTQARRALYSDAFTDAVPIASFGPGSTGMISSDLTEIVTAWQRYSESRGQQGRPNYGVELWQADATEAEYQPEAGCGVYFNSCDLTSLAGSAQDEISWRPVLEVTSLPAAPAGSRLVTPYEGHLTGRRVKLQTESIRSSVTSTRFQYIAGSQRVWSDIPLAALRTTTGDAVNSTDISMQGQPGDWRSQMVVWDLSAMPGGDVDGSVHVRAYLDSPVSGDGGITEEVNFRLDRRGIDGSASESIGPGEVNLLSGEFTLDEQDVGISAFLQDLKLTRTYRSRGVSRRTSDLFGPQWEASVEADGGELPYKGIYNYTEIDEDVIRRQEINPEAWNWELFVETFAFEDLGAEVETFQDIRRWEYHYAVVENSDGTKFTFKQTIDPDGRVTGWEPDEAHPGYKLTKTAGAGDINTMTLIDPSGGVALFRSEAAGSPNYRLGSFKQAGSTTGLSYEYQSVGTRQRLIRVTAPLPTGGAQRSLRFNWTDIATSGLEGVTSVPRVASIDFSNSYSTQTVAQYSYDSKGRLTRASDPRYGGSGLPTEYVYNDSRLIEVRPAGEEEWRLSYTSVIGDAGPRLSSVSRDHPDGGTATESVRYNVPVSGSGAPYDLSFDATRTWGQVDDLPWDATAIFAGDDVPSARDPDYSGATIFYLGLHGRAVNVATPGGHLTTAEFDANGNVIRTLSATNRARALASGTAVSASVAQRLSTRNQYAANGVDLVSTLEPESQFKLSDGRTVTGRRLMATHYDQGAPSTESYHLPTSVWRAVEISPGSRVDERELLRNSYADGGWAARQATTSTVDPNGRAIVTRQFLHPNYPVIEESRTPGGAGGGAGADVQFYVYYGIAPSARVPAGIASAGCGGFTGNTYPSGFLCLRSEATLPDAQIPRRWYDYNALGLAVETWEPRPLTWSGAGHRMTSKVYDAAGRLTAMAVSGGTGTAVPATTFAYSATTGRQIEVRAPGRGAVRRTYDSNGRLSQYVDASGTTSTYDYDLRGRIVERVVDGSRTTTYGYDARDNQTSIEDSTVGAAIGATFGPDGELLTETLPNGLVGSFGYDATGRVQKVSWDDVTDCTTGCTWVESEATGRDPDGNITGQRSSESQQTYSYDSAQRLTGVDDVRLADNRCTRRAYAYDVESNRVNRSDQTASIGGACGTGSVATRSWAHDQADRVTNSGWGYDSFGRATTLPAADSGGRSTLTSAYYVNDLVRQMTLDGRSHVYDRDPLDRTSSISSSGASKPSLTSTNHYADDGDSAIAVSRSDGGAVTHVTGPGGRLVATRSDGTLTYALRDLHGTVVAIASASTSDMAPIKRTETDEFGVIVSAASPVIDDSKGVPAYGWLGGQQRTTEFGQAPGSGGPMQMGVRVYLPSMGRFLQADPIDGGSANAYDYAFQNPVNIQDLDGRCPLCGLALVVGSRMAVQQAARIVGSGAVSQVVVRAGGGSAARKVAARNATFARVNKFELKSTSKHVLERMKGTRGDGGIAPWAVNHALHHGAGQCTGPNVYTFTSKYATVLVNSQTGKIFNAIPHTSAAHWGKAGP